jgi:hypothetical protein
LTADNNVAIIAKGCSRGRIWSQRRTRSLFNQLQWYATMLLCATAADLTIRLTDDIRATAKQLAEDLIAYYHGDEYGQTPGILPGPPPAGDYYWWEGGAMWGTLIDYWHLTVRLPSH